MKHSEIDEIETLELDFGMDATEIAEPVLPESFEAATKEEIGEVLAAFRRRAKDEEAAKKKNVSTEFWFAVYFASQEQRDVFLKAVDLIGKMDDQYIDGITFAVAVGVDMPEEEIKIPKSFRKPAGIDDLIIEI